MGSSLELARDLVQLVLKLGLGRVLSYLLAPIEHLVSDLLLHADV